MIDGDGEALCATSVVQFASLQLFDGPPPDPAKKGAAFSSIRNPDRCTIVFAITTTTTLTTIIATTIITTIVTTIIATIIIAIAVGECVLVTDSLRLSRLLWPGLGTTQQRRLASTGKHPIGTACCPTSRAYFVRRVLDATTVLVVV